MESSYHHLSRRRRRRCAWALSLFSPLLLLLLFWMMDLYRSGGITGWENRIWRSSETATATSNDTTATTTTVLTVPNVLIAGAQKAGTTSVANHLLERRDVCGPDARLSKIRSRKEAHYLDQDGAAERGAAPYAAIFAHCLGSSNTILLGQRRRPRLILDATPAYQLYPERVRAVYEELGPAPAANLKIVFILREPVSREVSWHHHLVTEAGREHPAAWATRHATRWDSATNATTFKAFPDYMRDEILPGLRNGTNRGLYARWLQRWLDAGFDRRQIFVAAYDEMLRDEHSQHAFLERLYQFLQLPPPRKRERLPWRNRQQQKGGGGRNKAEALAAAAAETTRLYPSCALQQQLALEYESANQELYQWLEAHPGPSMEQRPFPKFDLQCRED